MRCHSVPVIKLDTEFYQEDGLEKTRFDTAFKAVYEQRWGMVGQKTKLAHATTIYSSRKKK